MLGAGHLAQVAMLLVFSSDREVLREVFDQSGDIGAESRSQVSAIRDGARFPHCRRDRRRQPDARTARRLHAPTLTQPDDRGLAAPA